MNFFWNFEWNIVGIMCTLLGWTLITFWGLKNYREQDKEERPRIWRIVITVWIGLLSFSFNIPFADELLSLAILPLGVLVLYAFIGKQRWGAYRKYAWIGFTGNYIFLLTALLAIGLSSVFYPKDEVETFLADVDSAEILITHPSGEEVIVNKVKLEENLHSFEQTRSDVIQWFEEIREQQWAIEDNRTSEKVQERFPYLLTGVKPKTGEKITVYVEMDGKGLLVTTKNNQYYYRSDSASFLEKRGSAQ